MRVVLDTAPSGLPLDLQDVKNHRRIDNDSDGTSVDDAFLVGTAIPAACDYVERMCGRSFLTQTWIYYLDRFPWESRITLPRPPLQSVTSVKYLDTDGNEQTLSSANYIVGASTVVDPGFVELGYGKLWPSTYDQANSVYIEYVAGYGASPEDVPAPLRAAMMQAVAMLYEYREPVLTGESPADVILAGRSNMMWAMMDEYRLRAF